MKYRIRVGEIELEVDEPRRETTEKEVGVSKGVEDDIRKLIKFNKELKKK